METSANQRPDYPVEVKKVKYGEGLFCKTDVAKGTVLEKFEGKIVEYDSCSEYEKRYVLNFKSTSGEWKWLLATSNARYANHCCEANAFINDNQEIVAAADMRAGEEITFVYNIGEESDYWDSIWSFTCHCGAKNCQKEIDRYRPAADSMEHHQLIKGLKQQKQGQISKLQLKSEAENELLEVIKDYMAKRSEIENQYAKSLEKISKYTSSRKFRKVFGNIGANPLSLSDPLAPAKITYAAFATLVAESEKQAKERAQMSENIDEEITKVLKEFNKDKASMSKKLIDFGLKYQQEFLEAYDELDKARSNYDKLAKDTESSQKKYEDMLNKPKTAFAQLKVALTGKDEEERKSKWKKNSKKLNDFRNDYLLAVQSVNAIQNSYYSGDLPNLMTRLDGAYYPTISSLFEKFTNFDSTVSSGLASGIETVKLKIPPITRDRDISEFLQDYKLLFETPSQFSFEKYSSDEISALVSDESTQLVLGQKLGELILKEEEISNLLSVKEKELAGMNKIADAYSATPSFGDASSTALQYRDIETEVEYWRFRLTRMGPKIKMLRELGIEPIMPLNPNSSSAPPKQKVQDGLGMALYDYESQNETEISIKEGDELSVLIPDSDGWTKVRNVKSGASGLVPSNYIDVANVAVISGSVISRQQSELKEMPKFKASSPIQKQNVSQQVTAAYDYDALEKEEISFRAGDKIEVLGADLEGEWWEGKVVRTGQSGCFQILFTEGWEAIKSNKGGLKRSTSRRNSNSTATPSAKVTTARVLYDYSAADSGELSLVEGEILKITNMTGNDWWEGVGSKGKGQFPANYVEILKDSSASSPVTKSPQKTATVSKKSVKKVTALYDYEASSPDELSISAGDVITLINDSDESWWEGELNGARGNFPSNYVERC